jgi:PAS domain S-box-containing protein
VPSSLGFRSNPWLTRLLRVRQRPVAAYALAIALVVLAAALRWLVGENVGARIPFITFFPAIVLATLLGGLGPGILATIVSTVLAWFLFLPLEQWHYDSRGLVQLALFVFISAVNVAIVGVLSALVDRLTIQQRNIELLLDSAPSGFVLVDSDGIIKLTNASGAGLFGYEPDELPGKDIEVLVPQDKVEEHRRLRARYQSKPEVRAMGAGRDLNGRRKDGTQFPVEIGLNPLGHEGKPAVLATVVDISARKQAEESQRLLVRELDHRSRNIFAVVLALVTASGRGASNVEQLVRELTDRIVAVSKAYSMLSFSTRGVLFSKMLDIQRRAHPGRIAFEGDDVAVTVDAAQQLALILHELVTNALKHGALSTPEGRVAVTTKVQRQGVGNVLTFSWAERGGPPVAPPARQGFGTTLLRRVARQFGRDVAIDYRPEGLRYRLDIDLERVESREPDELAADAGVEGIAKGKAVGG